MQTDAKAQEIEVQKEQELRERVRLEREEKMQRRVEHGSRSCRTGGKSWS